MRHLAPHCDHNHEMEQQQMEIHLSKEQHDNAIAAMDKLGKSQTYWSDKAARSEYRILQLEDAARAAQRHLSIYRWVAILGWLIAICLLTLQPTYASAATLPAHSLACDNALTYEAQMLTFSDATIVADSGCVFTDRDLVVHVVSGNEVFVEEIGFSVWADVEVLK